MKRLAMSLILFSTPVLADTVSEVSKPICQPIGRTDKGDLVYSMDCELIPSQEAAKHPQEPLIGSGKSGVDPAPNAQSGKSR